jgi:hypothetical protein
MPLRLSFPGPMWVECERVQRLISYSFWRSRVCLICDYCLFSLFSLISLSARNERSAETVLKCWLSKSIQRTSAKAAHSKVCC